MDFQVSNLTDTALEELAEAIAREQETRQRVALRAIRNQKALFLPNRLYASAAR